MFLRWLGECLTHSMCSIHFSEKINALKKIIHILPVYYFDLIRASEDLIEQSGSLGELLYLRNFKKC